MKISQWITRLLKWLKVAQVVPSMPTPTPKPVDPPSEPTAPAVDLSGPLVDPPNPPYNQAYMDANGSSEECGIEGQRKIISRLCVIRGQSGGFWMLSSLDKGRIKRAADRNVGILTDWTEGGYSFHVKGYTTFEPQQREITTVPVSQSPEKYIVLEVRKA